MSDAVDFKQLFEAAPGLFLVLSSVGPRYEILAVTEAYLQATMTTRERLVGRAIFEAFPDNPGDPQATGVGNLRASIEAAIATGQPDTMAVQRYDLRRADGAFETRYWSPVNTPIRGPTGAIAYVIHRVEDVTAYVERRGAAAPTDRMEPEIYQRAQEIKDANRRLEAQVASTEAQLRQAQKLDALGRLAGGVAHDFNNMLSVILSCCAFTQQAMAADDPCREYLDEITLAGRRAADLTRQLLTFSRQQVAEVRVLDLDEVVTSVHRMLTRVVGEDVELRWSPTRRGSRILADRGHLEQVLMNLVINARDALPRGGTITVATADAFLDAAYAEQHLDVQPGPYVVLSVTDDGIGMDAATQARIFEPFFTTKPRGQGTGLGLSTVFGIVKQAGGHVWVYSEPGHGTTFKLYFPRTDRVPDPIERRIEPVVRGGGETVLVVEDQAPLRRVVVGALSAAGYTVHGVAHPVEALRLVAQPDVAVDLLLTDVVLPGMGGRELAERVAAARPSTRVLYTSGYTEDVVLREEAGEARVNFLEKPFTPDELLRQVRAALD